MAAVLGLAVAAGGATITFLAFGTSPGLTPQPKRLGGAILDPELRFDAAPRARVELGTPIILHASLPPGSSIEAGFILRPCGIEIQLDTYAVPADGRIVVKGAGAYCFGVTMYPVQGWAVAYPSAEHVPPGAKLLTEKRLRAWHEGGLLPHLTIVPLQFVQSSAVPHAPRIRSGCFDAGAGSLPAGNVRGPLVGDVNGDGRPDSVFANGRATPHRGCRYSVVVDTSSGTLRDPVTSTGIPAIPRRELSQFFSPSALFRLAGVQGKAILMRTWSGASTETDAVWIVEHGRLVRTRIEGAPVQGFALFGAADVGNWVDCVPGKPGTLVEGSYEIHNLKSGVFDISLVFYRLEGTRFVRKGTTHTHASSLRRYAAVDAMLPHCPGLVTSSPTG